MPTACLILISDFVWISYFCQVNVENVLKTFKDNAARATAVILKVIPRLKEVDWTKTIKANKVIYRVHVTVKVCKLFCHSFIKTYVVSACHHL